MRYRTRQFGFPVCGRSGWPQRTLSAADEWTRRGLHVGWRLSGRDTAEIGRSGVERTSSGPGRPWPSIRAAELAAGVGRTLLTHPARNRPRPWSGWWVSCGFRRAIHDLLDYL